MGKPTRPPCSLEGCTRPHHSHGYCRLHSVRWQRNGDPGLADIGTVSNTKPCTGPECDRYSVALGLCDSHYAQQKRGKPLTPIRKLNGRLPSGIVQRNRRYSITQDQYEAILLGQDGVCAICRHTNPGVRDLAVDHDHACCPGAGSCGKCIRSLLCGRCNVGIGQFLEDPELMRAAAAYVERWRDDRASLPAGRQCA